jgi:hypothetical protein
MVSHCSDQPLSGERECTELRLYSEEISWDKLIHLILAVLGSYSGSLNSLGNVNKSGLCSIDEQFEFRSYNQLFPRFRQMFRSCRDCNTKMRILSDPSKLTTHNNLVLRYNVTPCKFDYGNDNMFTNTNRWLWFLESSSCPRLCAGCMLTGITGCSSVEQKTHSDSGQPVGYNILRSIYSVSCEKLQNRSA